MYMYAFAIKSNVQELGLADKVAARSAVLSDKSTMMSYKNTIDFSLNSMG